MTKQQLEALYALRLAFRLATESGLFDLMQEHMRDWTSINAVCDAVSDMGKPEDEQVYRT